MLVTEASTMTWSRWMACLLACLLVGLSSCHPPEAKAPPPQVPEVFPAPTPLQNFSAPFYFGAFSVPVDNRLTEEAVALGRALFYETALSVDGSVSCATCHRPELAFTDGKAFSEGVHGFQTDRSAMSLVNLMWGPQHFFWDGRVDSLEAQALQPIENPNEMGETLENVIQKLSQNPDYPRMFGAAFGSREITAERIGKALASFERTLISANSKYDRYLRGETSLTEQELWGKQLFQTHPDSKANLRGTNCGDCHSPLLTSGFNTAYDGFTNNGLDTEENLPAGLSAITGKAQDRGKFKVPSLRNIALTAPYMHDGRFQTLEEVLDHYDQHIQESSTLDPLIREATNGEFVAGRPPALLMTAEEKAAVIAFLHTLTDETFISNPNFARGTPPSSTQQLPEATSVHTPPHPPTPSSAAPKLTLSFQAEMQGTPYPSLDKYPVPTGTGEFQIEDFKFYVSNIVLSDSQRGVTYTVPESYHLIYFADERPFEISIPNCSGGPL